MIVPAVYALLMLLALPAPVLAADPPNAACDVAMAVVALDLKSPSTKPAVYSDERSDAGKGEQDAKALLTMGWRKDPPSAELAAAYGARQASNAVADCPEVRASLEAHGLPTQAPSFEALSGMDKGPGSPIKMMFDVVVMWLAVPVVTSDGKEALVVSSYGCGMTCGGGFLVHWRKGDDGAWTPVDGVSGPIG